jgi:hypothetical protein
MTQGLPALQRVAAALRAEGGLLAGVAADPAPGTATPLGDRVALGPRAAGDPAEYAFVVEAVREGQLVHSGHSRIIDTGDTDLALLAGDRLYALGLSRLADRGDLDAVAALADVIAQCAQAHAAADPEAAETAWKAGVERIGWGPDG